MKLYNRLNPAHWLLALFSNSRKSDYLKPGALHVVDSKYKATQRILYWFRNPAHDFTHYIAGFQEDPEFKTVWESSPLVTSMKGWKFALRGYKWLPLPWVYYGSAVIVFYAGWSDGGKLGFKLRRAPAYMAQDE